MAPSAASRCAVDDPDVRRALTEPSAFARGFGFRFWEPPRPAVIGKRHAGRARPTRAGLVPGDRVVAIEGVAVADFPALVEAVSAQPGRQILVEYERDGVRQRTRVMTETDEVDGRRVGRIRVETPPPGPDAGRHGRAPHLRPGAGAAAGHACAAGR